MIARWVAWRIVREIVRDRRTLAFFFLVPLVVMTLVYYAVAEAERAKLGVVSRGTARLFEGDLVRALEQEKDIDMVSLEVPDEEIDPVILDRLIREQLQTRKADGILYLDERLLPERFDGRAGTLHLYLEGSRPTLSGLVLTAIGNAMDNLAAALPVVIDSSCSSFCANSVNNKPLDLEKIYLYGSEDYRLIEFFLPVFPPFFVFFFTFIISTITFQRERVRGTLERLLIAPVGFGEVVLGYIGGFFVFAGMQAAIVLSFVVALIAYPISATQIASIVVVTLLMLLIALVLGLLLSFLANSEFQALQFIPLVTLPQIFLSDMIWDIQAFPAVFRWISSVLPITHANAIMRDVLLKHLPLWHSWPQLLILGGFFLGILAVLVNVSRNHRRG